jgi:hypothetical protein
MASRKTVNEVRARLTGAKRPTASKGTPPRGKKTTGTPKSRLPVESPEPNRPQPKPPVVESRAVTPPRGRKVVDPRRKTNPPKKLTVTTGRRKPLRNSRSPFVFEYK